MPECDFSSDITALPGIGATRAKAFERLGIITVGDLLAHYPRSYQFRGDIKTLADGDTEQDCSYILTVTTQPDLRRLRGNMNILRFRASDDTGVCEITYFNQPYYRDQIKPGASFRFFGRLIRDHGSCKMTSPKLESVIPGRLLDDIVPLYPICSGVTQKLISDSVKAALSQVLTHEEDYLPENIRRRHGLAALSFALRGIHRPDCRETIDLAVKRLRFDEIFLFALALRITRRKRQAGNAPAMKNTDLSEFLSALSFTLTGAQMRAISDIVADMHGDGGDITVPLSRIVSGDVGSGKTAVAAAAVYIAVKNGFQAALMAPTEILATQHYNELSELFGRLGIKTALLTGSTGKAERKSVCDGLADGSIDFAVGTHALFGKDVKFKNGALFVTDEQHRFGVMQRAALSEKGNCAHVLVMSATPIPRTLALAMYGDLNISPLDELPPGRQRVSTYVVDSSYRDRLDAFIEKQAAEGHRTYVVCPMVEDDPENEIPELSSAVTYSEELAARLPGLRVGCMHGRLPAKEKDAVMSDFAEGRLDVLVSTTVIEVGVNVPEATLMVVVNAERFGLSQLHQLRGRVGRGSAKSYCVLISDSKGGTAKERLEVMRTTYDGYRIAERDLELRGPGDFFAGSGSVRQHGDIKFRLAAGMTDISELSGIFAEADRLLAEDPTLSSRENAGLLARIEAITAESDGTIS